MQFHLDYCGKNINWNIKAGIEGRKTQGLISIR